MMGRGRQTKHEWQAMDDWTASSLRSATPEAAADLDDGRDLDGFKGPAPGGGTDGPRAGAADEDTAKAVAKDADKGSGRADRR